VHQILNVFVFYDISWHHDMTMTMLFLFLVYTCIYIIYVAYRPRAYSAFLT